MANTLLVLSRAVSISSEQSKEGNRKMAEILGLGVTHWPTLCMPNEGLTGVFKRTLRAPNVEAARKDPASWPSELIAELGNDDGLSAANRCGERFGNDFRAIRKILDDFNPDLVLVWGDDQYENFREDIVPSFCLLGYDDQFDIKPGTLGNVAPPSFDQPPLYGQTGSAVP